MQNAGIVKQCKNENIKFADLPIDIESRSARKNELDNEVQAREAKLAHVKQAVNDAMTQAKATETQLEKFTSAMAALQKCNLPHDSIEAMANALKNAEAAGYDPSIMIDRITSIESLEQKQTELDAMNKEQDNKINETCPQ